MFKESHQAFPSTHGDRELAVRAFPTLILVYPAKMQAAREPGEAELWVLGLGRPPCVQGRRQTCRCWSWRRAVPPRRRRSQAGKVWEPRAGPDFPRPV